MSLLEMQGVFTSGLVKRTVKWSVDEEDFEAEVYVKPLSFSAAVSTMINQGEDAEKAIAERIAVSICDAKGKPIFTVGDILGTSKEGQGAICESLTYALLAVIGEVKGSAKKQKKLSKKKKSG